MKTAVMTDTNSGIMKAEADSMGIFLIPMPVIINDETHYEGIDLTETSFYGSLTGGMNVSTSQPSPGDLMDLWDDILEQGYDEIIHIPMSSGLSASCSTAISLSDDYDGKVQVADNHRISVTQKESVMHAKKLADAGKSAKEIKEVLEAEAYNSSIYIAVDTLEFLKKGGRVTAAGAALGSVLNIKPILTIQGGKLDAFAKTRGMKKCKQKMVEALKNDRETRFKDADDKHILIGNRVVVAVNAVAAAEDEFHPGEVVDRRAVFGHVGEDGAFVCVPNLGVSVSGDCLNEEQSRLITGHALIEHEVAVLIALHDADGRQMMRRVGIIRAALRRAGRDDDRARDHQGRQHQGKKFSQISHVCSPSLLSVRALPRSVSLS